MLENNSMDKFFRFGTQWETGYVTCFHREELGIMKDLLKKSPSDILQAGLHPTFDQVITIYNKLIL